MTDILARIARGAPSPAADAAARAAAQLASRAAQEGLLDVAYTSFDSPLGPLLLASTPRGLLRLSFSSEEEVDGVLERIAQRVSPRVLEAPARLDPVRRELDEYFEGRRREFDIELDWTLIGEGFGRRVLEQTALIPSGEVSTYREIAAAAGNVAASRATGNALGANPIPIVIPCHRVLRTGGGLGGYGGGLDNKRTLLALEGIPQP